MINFYLDFYTFTFIFDNEKEKSFLASCLIENYNYLSFSHFTKNKNVIESLKKSFNNSKTKINLSEIIFNEKLKHLAIDFLEKTIIELTENKEYIIKQEIELLKNVLKE